MRDRECPKCGKPMDHQEEESDVGVLGCWYCSACEHTEDDADDYVMDD